MIYIIHVQSGKETDIVAELGKKGITAFAPQYDILERRKGKWNTVTKIVFSGYVFIDLSNGINDEDYYSVKETTGVVRFLGKPITPLPEAEEVRLRWILEAQVISVSHGFVKDGRVHITDGILTGREHCICKYSVRHKRCTLHCTINGKIHYFDVSCELTRFD